VDPSVVKSPWIAIPRSQNGFKENLRNASVGKVDRQADDRSGRECVVHHPRHRRRSVSNPNVQLIPRDRGTLGAEDMYCLDDPSAPHCHGCGANSAGDYRAETDQRPEARLQDPEMAAGPRLERGRVPVCHGAGVGRRNSFMSITRGD